MADTLDRLELPVRVLLVDDDPDIRAMYASRLAADGFEVLLAADGSQALAAAAHPLRLILLDVRMPGVGGLEVLHRLKALAGTVPVVMLSNESDESIAAACRTMGAVAWWSKCGMAPSELCRRVRELLDLTPH